MSSSKLRKSNDLSDGDVEIKIVPQQRQHYHQDQPESSASSSSYYQQSAKSEKSDDLAPILSHPQKRHSSTTATTTTTTAESYHEANGDAHHYSKGDLDFSVNDRQNIVIPPIWKQTLNNSNSGNNNKNNDIMIHGGGHLLINQRQRQDADAAPQAIQHSNNDNYSDTFLGSLLLILFIQSVVVIVLEGFQIHQTVFQSSQCLLSSTGIGVSFTNLIYRALFVTISLYQLLLCVDTLRQRSTAQLYALILFGFLYVVFGIIQIYQNQAIDEWMIKLNCRNADESSRTLTQRYEYALLSVVPACFLVFIGCCVWQHRQFTWCKPFLSSWTGSNNNNNQQKMNANRGADASINTNVNIIHSNDNSNRDANPRVKKAAISLSTLLALIKLDLFFCFSFSVQLSPSALLGYDTTTTESLLVAGIGAVLFIITYYAVLNQKTWILGVMTLLKAISIAYFVFRLIMFAQPSSSSGNDPYRATRYSLIYTLLVLVILITLTSGVGVASIRNMMHGVKILRDSPKSTSLQSYNAYTAPASCYNSDHGKDNPLPSFSGPEIRNH